MYICATANSIYNITISKLAQLINCCYAKTGWLIMIGAISLYNELINLTSVSGTLFKKQHEHREPSNDINKGKNSSNISLLLLIW